MLVEVRRLSSGYWHIRGNGPCEWAQVPTWPCDETTLRAGAFPEASEVFIRATLEVRPWERARAALAEGGGQ